jgi:hypothetical protein
MMIDETEGERIMAIESGLSLCYYWDGTIIGRAAVKQSTVPLTQRNADRLIADVSVVVDKHMVDIKDGTEKMWFPRTQRGTNNTVLSELTYAYAMCGATFAPYNWLMFKSFSYLMNMGAAMWTSFNPTNMWAPHLKKYIKDVVLHDVDAKNITNLRDSLPELLATLREHDGNQILRAVGGQGALKPLDLLWAHDWDVRELSPTQAEQVKLADS